MHTHCHTHIHTHMYRQDRQILLVFSFLRPQNKVKLESHSCELTQHVWWHAPEKLANVKQWGVLKCYSWTTQTNFHDNNNNNNKNTQENCKSILKACFTQNACSTYLCLTTSLAWRSLFDRKCLQCLLVPDDELNEACLRKCLQYFLVPDEFSLLAWQSLFDRKCLQCLLNLCLTISLTKLFWQKMPAVLTCVRRWAWRSLFEKMPAIYTCVWWWA